MKTSLWCHRLTLWSLSFRTQRGMIERAWIMEPVRPGFKSFTKELIALYYAFLHAKSLQSCPSLCDPMDCTPPGSSVHGVLPCPPPGDLSKSYLLKNKLGKLLMQQDKC